MKRTLIIICITLLSFVAFSKDVVKLTNIGSVGGAHSSCVPIVEYNENGVEIRCDSTIYDVGVVVKDQYGNVMHQSTQTVGSEGTVIYVPDTGGDSEKTTIDLYYDRKHLSGYFN
ncbi:hypothetical protein [uncultured Prevotella sp.]|uniref:DUF3244 domain-containing protein n=1 Tax=uncultured Prevotella sp. TaxID=159272 RepID=UPI00259A2C78|nr:hypothetical protein [uncultured Prevotella sp.]